MLLSRQADRELCVGTRLTIDLDAATVLLRDNVVTDRQPQTRALAGRLCREEGLEQLVPDLGRDTGAVVAHRDLDQIAAIAGRHGQGRSGVRTGGVTLP